MHSGVLGAMAPRDLATISDRGRTGHSQCHPGWGATHDERKLGADLSANNHASNGRSERGDQAVRLMHVVLRKRAVSCSCRVPDHGSAVCAPLLAPEHATVVARATLTHLEAS